MIRKSRSPLAVLLCLFLAHNAAMAEEGIDVDYAEMMPLAAESMLLDLIRTADGFVAVGERGHIVHSTDGKTWTQAEHVPTRATLTTVFSTGNRIWAGGHDAALLTSGDGGKNWTLQFFDPDRQQAVMDIHFTDESNGVAIGSYGLSLVTTDGGVNWEDQIVDEENDFHLNDMIHFGEGRRMIAGEAGLSYRSFDDGQSWELMSLPYQGSMWGAIKPSENCVLFFGLRGHILESCDFGDNWTELESEFEASLSAAAAQGGEVVFAGNSGMLLTRNASGDFSAYQHSSGVDFSSIVALDDGSYLLTGEEGTHFYPEAAGGDNVQ